MDILLFLIFLSASVAAGSTGMMFPTGSWYKTLSKPDWVPPNWAFPVVWTSIYVLIAFAGARVAGLEGSGYAMAFWAGQIALNTLWTPVFFGLRNFKAALVIICALWLMVAGATVAHFMLDFWAGLAFVPYLIWLTLATGLHLTIMRLDPDVIPLQPSEL